MGDLNKGIVIGRLGDDPKNFNDVVKFSVGTKRRSKEDVTDWFTITAFKKLGEIATKYLKKGMEVYIEGEMRLSTYTDKKDKIEKLSFEIIAHDIQMLGKKPK